MNITCHFCNYDFESEMWIVGNCPYCKEEYYFDEYVYEGMSYIMLMWTN